MTSTEFKDLFSKQSNHYAQYRPTYPEPLFKYLSSLVKEHKLAWDCGTGNGQAAMKLADYFDQIIATDPSSQQISKATQHPKIEYRVGSAEKTTFNPNSVDLITVAQAFHWFDQKLFFSEVERILKPNGVLALWCYELCKISPEVDAVVWHLYKDILGPDWEPERKLVEEGYKNVHLPFQEISTPPFEMNQEWSLEHLVGYLNTWSALQTFLERTHSNPVTSLLDDLKKAWGDLKSRPIRWELSCRVGRKT